MFPSDNLCGKISEMININKISVRVEYIFIYDNSTRTLCKIKCICVFKINWIYELFKNYGIKCKKDI